MAVRPMPLGRDDVDMAWLGRSPGARDTALGSERRHGEAALRRVATQPGRREKVGPHRGMPSIDRVDGQWQQQLDHDVMVCGIRTTSVRRGAWSGRDTSG
jgi:hypothetical protein